MWKHLSFFSSFSPPAAIVWGLKRQRTAPLGNIAPHGSSVEVVLVLVGVVWLLETESVALLGHYDDCLGITDRWFACFAFAPERQVRYGLEFKFSVFCIADHHTWTPMCWMCDVQSDRL